MSMSSEAPQSSFVSDPNAPPPSSPALSLPATTQVIPGTTVVGTGVTGDVWSYTIPAITSPSAPAPTTQPSPSSQAPTSAPEPSGTYVATQIVLSGTTVVGGTETGVPWSYTIPDQSVVTSVFVPITVSQTATPSESSPLSNSLTSRTDSPTPLNPSIPGYTEPVPRPLPDASHTTLSGGIVAAILISLVLLMLAIAGCAYIRGRRRQHEGGGEWDRAKMEKDVGVVWGRGWGSEDKSVAAWRKRQMGYPEGGGDGYHRSVGSEATTPAGLSLGPNVRFQQGPMVKPTPGNESAERLIDRLGRDAGSSSLNTNTRLNNAPQPNANIIYPVTARYPQTYGSDKIPDIDTRASLSHPTQSNVNTRTNDDTDNKEPTSSKSPIPKSKRPIPAPSPHVYAPPPGDTREPSPKAPHFTNPFSTRPTSPYRTSSPYASHSSTQGRKVLSKQRAPVLLPSTSAFMRHMLPTRTMSLRRPKAAPPEPSPSTAASAPARPGLSTLPSFIRDRRFASGPSRSESKSTSQSGGESVIFSPSPRPAAQLPPHAPTRVSSPISRSAPLVQPRSATTRDKYLAPPSSAYGAYGGRDRSSQLTSTTRSGGTGWSRDTRSTGRSGGSAVTGRSGESRVTGTGRSGRGGALAQIPESDREVRSERRGHDRPRERYERP